MTHSLATNRIYLSPPQLCGREQTYLMEAISTNWVAPVGPHVDRFEAEFARIIGLEHAIAVSSGTAAMHLAIRHLKLHPGEEVFCSSSTFAASINPVVYERGTPVFIDSDPATWTIDCNLLAEELERCAIRGRLPRAVIAVDLYGQCADWNALRELCASYEVPLIEDAAEALGATFHDRPAGSFGWANIFSFNGNKIITTSGGGMLATNDEKLAAAARHLATQARDPAPHYEHSTIGYNYRLSNLLAGVGRAQLEVLPERVAARRAVFEFYRNALGEVPGIEFMPEAPYGRSNRWLTCILVDPDLFGATREDIRLHLDAHNIESRPTWKPMHLQPVFRGCRAVGGSVSERIFEWGLCLPSGSSLTTPDLRRIVTAFLSVPRLARVQSGKTNLNSGEFSYPQEAQTDSPTTTPPMDAPMTNTTGIEVLTMGESAEWMRVLDRCAPYDFYHLPEYHALAEDSGEGTAHLFVYTEGAYTIALPLLLREINDALRDATSVYGYAGPVCSNREIPEAVAARFQEALTTKLRDMSVVTVFSRLHPFVTQPALLAGLGERRLSQTVSIDLTLAPEVQRAKYRKAFKVGINKLRRNGVTVVHDREGTYLHDFVKIYHETMHRVAAADRYFFSAEHFEQLWKALGSRIHLFACLHEGRPVCAGLFVICHGIIQYHLSGTLNDALSLAPMKLMVDEVRLWGHAQGMKLLHLGGGTTADRDDSLFQFKIGFSDRTHEFVAWRWILAPDDYDRLCAAKAEADASRHVRPANADFFPAYRAPVVSIDETPEPDHVGRAVPLGAHAESLIPLASPGGAA